mmetsp:Transcript_22448/g.56730  ORF Transcript_22448/g.56730 Transcript_22448/m.56730 type:complete len:239 (+) Transcript_22448:234-950(+)
MSPFARSPYSWRPGPGPALARTLVLQFFVQLFRIRRLLRHSSNGFSMQSHNFEPASPVGATLSSSPSIRGCAAVDVGENRPPAWLPTTSSTSTSSPLCCVDAAVSGVTSPSSTGSRNPETAAAPAHLLCGCRRFKSRGSEGSDTTTSPVAISPLLPGPGIAAVEDVEAAVEEDVASDPNMVVVLPPLPFVVDVVALAPLLLFGPRMVVEEEDVDFEAARPPASFIPAGLDASASVLPG